MKRYVFVFFLFLSFAGRSQISINNYKYVVVPEKFSFLKENDQYSLNSLTKALLQDKGFIAYFDNNELPGDVANNKCRALSVELLEKSGMFTTTLTLLLKDCQGNIIFKSKEGKSREKEYQVAYSEALRDAFKSLNKVSYVDAGSTNAPAQPTITTTAPEAPVKSTAATTNQPNGTLYAQAIANGYQLIDTTPKVVLTMLKTSAADYFIASNATANGIVLKKGEDWIFEYYKDGKLVSEKLLVKF